MDDDPIEGNEGRQVATAEERMRPSRGHYALGRDFLNLGWLCCAIIIAYQSGLPSARLMLEGPER
jgi:hypothetical protein